jgi:hypothetical protein
LSTAKCMSILRAIMADAVGAFAANALRASPYAFIDVRRNVPHVCASPLARDLGAVLSEVGRVGAKRAHIDPSGSTAGPTEGGRDQTSAIGACVLPGRDRLESVPSRRPCRWQRQRVVLRACVQICGLLATFRGSRQLSGCRASHGNRLRPAAFSVGARGFEPLTSSASRKRSPPELSARTSGCYRSCRGGDRNRTGVRGFAGPCLNHSATPPGWSSPGCPGFRPV